jgi:nitroreductase
MDTLTAIYTRRSIRKYTSKVVPEDLLDGLLKAAMLAPSALDERPWHFVVIRQQEILENLADRMEHCEMLREATLGVLICGDTSLEQIEGFWVQDCSACAQNVLLAAHAMGLGAVWIGLHPLTGRMNTIREILGVPESIIPFALISLGYPGELLPAEDRFDSSRIHTNRW